MRETETAVSIFREKKLFSNDPCVIDTPYKRFEGLEGVESL